MLAKYNKRNVIRFGDRLLSKIYENGYLEKNDSDKATNKQRISLRDETK